MMYSADQFYRMSDLLFVLAGIGGGITFFIGIRYRVWNMLYTDSEEMYVMEACIQNAQDEDAEAAGPCRSAQDEDAKTVEPDRSAQDEDAETVELDRSAQDEDAKTAELSPGAWNGDAETAELNRRVQDR
ncbi:MAG: hypothetical protein ACI4ET_12175 [Bilifractor sp.]